MNFVFTWLEIRSLSYESVKSLRLKKGQGKRCMYIYSLIITQVDIQFRWIWDGLIFWIELAFVHLNYKYSLDHVPSSKNPLHFERSYTAIGLVPKWKIPKEAPVKISHGLKLIFKGLLACFFSKPSTFLSFSNFFLTELLDRLFFREPPPPLLLPSAPSVSLLSPMICVDLTCL